MCKETLRLLSIQALISGSAALLRHPHEFRPHAGGETLLEPAELAHASGQQLHPAVARGPVAGVRRVLDEADGSLEEQLAGLASGDAVVGAVGSVPADGTAGHGCKETYLLVNTFVGKIEDWIRTTTKGITR